MTTNRSLTSDKQMNTASLGDLSFVLDAFGRQVTGVAVEDVNVLRKDVDVLEEVVPHKVVIALRMVARKPHVLVHVERFHVLERNSALFVKFDQLFVHSQWCASYQNIHI